MIKTQNWLERGAIPDEWVAIPREHWKEYMRDHAEVERLQLEYAELAAAVWACPADELDSSHAETVAEAEMDVIKAAEAAGGEG